MQISAFVDGELPDNEADLLLRRMSQDAELRQEVAEFLAIGRIMRGEGSVPGVDSIHDRVLAGIDDKDLGQPEADQAQPRSRSVRPLIGIAVAASVALLAIFGLQQTSNQGPDVDTVDAGTVAAESYTVPQPADDQLREYHRSHGESATENGANGMKARLVTLMRQEAFDEPATADEDGSEDESSNATPEATTTP